MREIVEETYPDSCNNANPATRDGNMVEINLKIIGPARPSRIQVASPIKVCDLRKLISEENHFPIENLRLILCGKVLHDSEDGDDICIRLNNGDSLIVVVKPKPPTGLEIEDDDDDLEFRLPHSTSRWKRKLYCFLHNRMKVPGILLMALFSLSLKAWTIVVLWFALAPLAHRWDLGPLYILGTGFSIILLNLGQRQPGDISAYSIFNEDFRELPGTLNADRLDRDVRTGQF